jgi:riboflavin biosynthesis pyrimidine reductase
MRVLWPAPGDVDPVELYAPGAGDGRPWVRVNMIASVDGATAVQGRSGALGGPADHDVFLVLRSLADVIVVGAGTVRAEGYGPVRLPEDRQAARLAAGLSPVPAIAVVTRSGRLDWSSQLFTESAVPPLVITSAAGAAALPADAPVEVLVAGDDDVDLAESVRQLGERGFSSALVEGGPTLNGQLVAAGVLDDLCLTMAPVLVGGTSSRIVAGPAPDSPLPLRLAHLAEGDGLLFTRWLRT